MDLTPEQLASISQQVQQTIDTQQRSATDSTPQPKPQPGQQSQQVMIGNVPFNSLDEANRAVTGALERAAADKAELQRKLDAALAQQQPQPQPQQGNVTGKEPAGYDHRKFMTMLTADDHPLNKARAINYALTGNEDLDAGQILRVLAGGMITMQQKIRGYEERDLRSAHPEVAWDNPQVTGLIDRVLKDNGLSDDPQNKALAIRALQGGKAIPTREQWEQQMAVSRQQAPAEQAAHYLTIPDTDAATPLNVQPIRPSGGPPALGRLPGSAAPVPGAQVNIDELLPKLETAMKDMTPQQRQDYLRKLGLSA